LNVHLSNYIIALKARNLSKSKHRCIIVVVASLRCDIVPKDFCRAIVKICKTCAIWEKLLSCHLSSYAANLGSSIISIHGARYTARRRRAAAPSADKG
jgi:hypothetical protein